MIRLQLLTVLVLALTAGFAQAIDSCSRSSDTLYDSYLNPYIYYAEFNKDLNSYFKIPNPFINQESGGISIHFWARYPQVSLDGSMQSGVLVDCGNIAELLISGETFDFMSGYTSNDTSVTLSSIITSSNLDLTEWNHYAVSFNSGRMYIFLNANQDSTKTNSNDFVRPGSAHCMVGNSLGEDQGSSVLMRHLAFLSKSLHNQASFDNMIHHVVLPDDLSVLAYYKFTWSFNYQQTYTNTPSVFYDSNNLNIYISPEPEFVCYCTGQHSNFMIMTSEVEIFPQEISGMDNQGFMLEFTIFSTYPSPEHRGDVLLFSLEGYAELYLVDSLSKLRLDLNDNGTMTQFPLDLSVFPFNFWAAYLLKVTPTEIELSISREILQTLQIDVSLPADSTIFQIASPVGFEYLVYLVTLSNSSFNDGEIWHQRFTAGEVTARDDLVSRGSLVFSPNAELCGRFIILEQTYWTGESCSDLRVAPTFLGSSVPNGRLEASLQSSKSQMTVEFWVYDTLTATSQEQVIFDNSNDDGETSLVRISITTGASNNAARNISCWVTGQEVVVSSFKTYNQWSHIACVSDSQLNQVTLYVTQSSTETSSLAGTTFSQQDGSLRTTVGSDVRGNASTKFQGFMKELRIWHEARSELELDVFRYQLIPDRYPISFPRYYYKMIDQFNPRSIIDSGPEEVNLNQQTLNAIVSFEEELDLVLCQDGYYYNGQCCEVFDISSVNFKLTQSSSNQIFKMSITSNTLDNAELYPSMRATYSLESIGRNYPYNDKGDSTDYLSYLQQLFSAQDVQSHQVSDYLVNPNVYSLTVKAAIYSIYNPGVVVEKTQTLEVKCPNLWLFVVPDQISTEYQIVTNNDSMTSPIINLKREEECYQESKGTFSQISFSSPSINWGWDLSDTFTRYFTMDGNDLFVQKKAKKSIFTGNKKQVNVDVSYSVSQVNGAITASIPIEFEDITIFQNDVPLLSEERLVQGDSNSVVTIDLSGISSSHPDLYPVTYLTVCPGELFSSQDNYNQICFTGENGILELVGTDFDVIPSIYSYPFNIYVVLQATAIMLERQVSLLLYRNGGSENCPRIQLNDQYSFSQFGDSQLTLVVDPYLSCDGAFYQLLSANWTSNDPILGQQYDIFTYGDQKYFMETTITPTSSKDVMAGALLTVGFVLAAAPISDSNILIEKPFTTQIQFAQQNLEPVITLRNSDGDALNMSLGVDFVESNLILDGRSSFDPDNSSAILSYSWTCPDQLTLYYTCESLVREDRGSPRLEISSFQRSKALLQFGQPYSFGLTVTSVDNPYKSSQSISVDVYFSAPVEGDVSQNTISSSCNTIDGSYQTPGGLYYYSRAYPYLQSYDIENLTDVTFNVTYTKSTSQSCMNLGIVQEQRILFYIFDSPFMGTNEAAKVLLQEDSNVEIHLEGFINIDFSGMFSNLESLELYQFYPMNVYFFVQRNSGELDYSLNIVQLQIVRYPAKLVAQLANSEIVIDRYADLMLDASSSFDTENLNMEYTYKWTCPGNNAICKAATASTLMLTPINREDADSNANDTSYTYSVAMTDGIRTSEQASVTVNITQLVDYQECLEIQFNDEFLPANYWADRNQTIYIQYDQVQDVEVILEPVPLCTYASPFSTQYSQFSGASDYWNTYNNNDEWITFTNSKVSKNIDVVDPARLFVEHKFIMGSVTSEKYILTDFINLEVQRPDLQAVISGRDVMILEDLNADPILILSGQDSTDPLSLGFEGRWACPDYLGGATCLSSASTTLELTYEDLQNLYGGNLADLAQQSHQFRYTIISHDSFRQNSDYFYVYFGSIPPFSFGNASYCGINVVNGERVSLLPFNQQISFEFNCQSEQVLTDNILEAHSIAWSIPSLTINVDYFQSGQLLYLQPYALSKVSSSIEVELVLTQRDTTKNFKQIFFTSKTYLQSGYAEKQPLHSTGIAYSQLYSLSIVGFSSQRYTGLQFQVRGLSKLQQYNQVLFPIKPYSTYITNIYYQQIPLSEFETLYLDFYDMDFVYLGSRSILSELFVNGMQLGQINLGNFESWLSDIVHKTSSSYGSGDPAKLDYEIDSYLLRQLSESLQLNLVEAGNYSTYYDEIIDYMDETFLYLLSQYGGNLDQNYEYPSKNSIELNAVFILNGVINNNHVFSTARITSILDIMATLINDFSLITELGDSQEAVRQAGLRILQTLDHQLDTKGNVPASTYNTLQSLNSDILGSEVANLAEGESTVAVSGSTSRETLLLTKNSSGGAASFEFSNNFNAQEKVLISNQQLLVNRYGVESLETSFTLVDNASSPISSVIHVNAYNANSTSMALQMDSDDITLQFEVKSSFQPNFYNLTEKWPICTYYDNDENKWSQAGLTFESYDNSTGVLKCRTTHLSKFSVDYLSIQVPLLNTTNISNRTNNTNSTVGDPVKYFEDNKGRFIFSIAIGTLFITLCWALTLRCSRTKVTYHIPDLDQDTEIEYSLGSIICEGFLHWHTYICAFVGPKTGNIYLTNRKYNSMVYAHTYFFLICLLARALLMLGGEDLEWSYGAVVGRNVVLFLIFWVLKGLFSTLNFYTYFRSYPIPVSEQVDSQRQHIQNTEQMALKQREKSKEEEDQLEGGEGEESKTDQDIPSQSKPMDAPQQHQPKKDVSSERYNNSEIDLDLEEIDIEVEKAGKNEFFSRTAQKDDVLQSPREKSANPHDDVTNAKSLDSEQKKKPDPEEKKNLSDNPLAIYQNSFQELNNDQEGPEGSEQKMKNDLEDYAVVKPNPDTVPVEPQADKEESEEVVPPEPRNKVGLLIGVIFKIIMLYVSLFLTCYFLYMLPLQEDVIHFGRSVFGILIIQVIIWEPLIILIISMVFRKMHGRGSALRIIIGVLYGNFHPNMTKAVLYSLQTR